MKFEEIYKKVLDADKKYKELGIPINLDLKIEDLCDALRNENAYLRRLALHALSGWAIGISLANSYLPKGTRKKQIKYFMVFKKFENLHNIEKDKWKKERWKK